MDSIKLFGYFFYELEGIEKILIKVNENNSWDFSIKREIDSIEEIENELDNIVNTMIQEKIISFESLLEVNLEKYTVIKISNTQAQFVKIKIGPQFTHSNKYQWTGKDVFTKNNCNSDELLNLILNDYIFQSHGLKVLECIDAVVYRKQTWGNEFLLLRRKIGTSNDFKYEYPKGGLKYHETILEGALRELKEETGVVSYAFKKYLGLKAVDVRERKSEYDIIRVHGLAFEYSGSGKDIIPSLEEGFDKIYDWVSFDEAVKRIWMRTYGVEFLKAFKLLIP
jgi:8-oxo-dGTP pyrophosphatase MutT (NUDIX family)